MPISELAVGRVALRVSDPAASAAFYRDLVGLEISEEGEQRALLCAPGSREPVLELLRAPRAGPAPVDAAGLFHTAFLYPTRGALGAALARIGAGAGQITGVADHGVSEALYLDDPDGLGIELYRDRRREEWPAPAPGERVGMYTKPLDLRSLAAAADAPESGRTDAGVRIGHVHLKVADLDAARRFWTETVGLELMATYPGAIFCAAGGYHHHIGANVWRSAGRPREPVEGPGLERVTLDAEPPLDAASTPDGIPIETYS